MSLSKTTSYGGDSYTITVTTNTGTVTPTGGITKYTHTVGGSCLSGDVTQTTADVREIDLVKEIGFIEASMKSAIDGAAPDAGVVQTLTAMGFA